MPEALPGKALGHNMAKVSVSAFDLEVEEVVMGLSEKMSAENQMESLTIAWGSLASLGNRSI